ncbi:MAG: glycoside hydrolase family 3 C-terminal domain-containing protein [Lachnospiraceae bacterium]|nr:glycoside hydrolase family 3 C-terminal domain-containing protein [Lachnospiraceae bacterium]
MNRYFATTEKGKTAMEQDHLKLARAAAAEGIVLLENKNCLPLKGTENIALFGDGARETLICGLGAASMNYRNGVSIEKGLKNAGFVITTSEYLARMSEQLKEEQELYYNWVRAQGAGDLLQGVLAMYSQPFVPSSQRAITEADITGKAEADLAVFVISRCSGEGADRKNVPGDYQLLEDEKKNLRFLDAHFSEVIVLLNTVGVIDTKFIRSLKHVKALLFIGLGGAEAGNALADVLLGKIPPQGKLTAAWAENYEDYPNALTYAGMNGNVDDELYSEGIFVGYRYFDSFGIRPAYPFGYGMTYAKFDIQTTNLRQEGERLFVSARVSNVSTEYSGREVVQIYISPPQAEAQPGKRSDISFSENKKARMCSVLLPKAYQNLSGYARTRLLQPQESEELEIELDMKSMASYSEKEAAWLLEAGDYLVRVGNSSRNTTMGGIWRVKDRIVLERCRNLFQTDDWMEEQEEAFMREQKQRGRKQCEMKECVQNGSDAFCILTVDAAAFHTKIHSYRKPEEDAIANSKQNQKQRPTYADVYAGKISLAEFVDSLTIEEMARICVGNVPEEMGEVTRASVMAAGTAVRQNAAEEDFWNPIVPGASEMNGSLQKDRRIPKMNLADGGSGLRLVAEFETDESGELLTSGLFSIRGVDRIAGKKPGEKMYTDSRMYYQYTTALPMAVILAQTWDADLVERCGEMIGRELSAFGVDLWLAPSMNIHRNPLCGRNYEYYSEDPLVTGVCGCAMVHGVQLFHGVGATIKHLACNNQETNRGASNAHVSERALREIYLRGYERVILREKPLSMMTSLNLINGIHAANSYDLLTAFARDECGFDGFVMTDWGTTVSDPSEKIKYPCSSVAGCLNAGNDLIMPGTISDVEGIISAVYSGDLTLRQLRECVSNILVVMLRMNKKVKVFTDVAE